MNTVMNPSVLPETFEEPTLVTIVVQPNGSLDRETAAEFIQQVTRAVGQVSSAVIVDLLWVLQVDAVGIAALVTAIDLAKALGKSISFQSMQPETRSALATALDRRHQEQLGAWQEVMNADLEQFLTRGTHSYR